MNNPEPRLSWSEFAQPRSWPLPIKLVAVVAVPALFAITVGALRVLDQSGLAADFDQVDRVAALQEEYSELTVELQDERDQAVLFVAVRDRQDPAAFERAADATDAARNEATNLLVKQPDLNSGSVGALRQVDNNYFRLTQLRRQVLTGANDAADLFAQYNVIVEPLLVFDSALTRQLSGPEIGGLSQAIGALVEAREQVAAQQTLVNAVLDGGTLLDPQAEALRAADGRLLTATSTVRSVLSDEQQARYTGFAGSVAATREQLKQSILERGRAGLPLEVAPQTWNDASAAVLKQIDTAEDGARAELRGISAIQQEAASNRAGINSVILLLAILLGAGIVYLVAKALIGSLRTLRIAALDVADRRLPEAVQSMREGAVPDIDVAPVPVTTREEIGQVARAFDAVHSQAVRLAAEQATLQSNVSSMFANLSRRSQALAERQLKLIEQLESNEQDPDQLSNLFQLDSLATRMRRNSENLLVLSGTDLSKRASQPVPVVDVLRAAVSEVEQYQRVVVQSPPDATIAGRAASDIVHLLAELVDNATNFSAPDTQVVMSSQRTSDGSVLIEIVDQGVGMGGDDLDDANQRLARPTALDVSVSRRMGLFVVGRLAARHGLGVRLGNPTNGTTASVTVPAYLVTGSGSGPLGGTGMAPIPPAGIGLGTPPGREFVPTPRGGVNGVDRPAPLSALVAGADAPIGSPGGPLPGAPTRQPTAMGMPLPPASINGAPGAPSTTPGTNGNWSAGWPEPTPMPADDRATPGAPAVPDAEGLPTRLPGRLLGQAPPTAPGTPAAPAAPPTPEQPRPAAMEPADGRHGHSQPTVEQSGPQRPVPRPAPTPSSSRSPEPPPATEAFAVQPPASTRPAQPTSTHAQATAQSGPSVQPGRSQPQADLSPPPPNQRSQPLPARPSPQARPAQPMRSQAETSAPSLPIRQPAQNRQAAPPQPQPQPQPQAGQPPTAAPPPRPPARSADRVAPPPGPQPSATPRPKPSPGVGREDEARQPGSLFAPAGPVGSDTPAANAGNRSSGSIGEPTETTPIFEEIASAWFREDRAVPISYDGTGSGPSTPPSTPPKAAPPAARPSLPTRSAPRVARPGATVSSTSSGSMPASAPPVPAAAPPREPTVAQPRPAPRPVPTASAGIAAPSAFSTAADDGWRASAAAAEVTGDELTPAGLPKRRPRARLIPGAAGVPVGPPAAAIPPSAATRTAESIRGRLSSYQDGVRQGRELRMRREAAASSNGHPTSNRNEENT